MDYINIVCSIFNYTFIDVAIEKNKKTLGADSACNIIDVGGY
jgi:hypothetical protein